MKILHWILEKLWHLILSIFFTIFGTIVMLLGIMLILAVFIRHHIEETFLLIFRR